VTLPLAFIRPALQYGSEYTKKNPHMHFIQLGNKETYCISRHAVQPLFYSPQNAGYFTILPPVVHTIGLLTFFINLVLKFKQTTIQMKVNPLAPEFTFKI
jgi:hypothetical protein